MAFIHGNGSRLYVNGREISEFVRSISGPREVEANESTTMRTRDRTFVPGLRNGTLSADGLWDASGLAASVDEYLDSIKGVRNLPFCWTVGEESFGSIAYGLLGQVTSYEVSTPHDDIADFSLEAQGSGPRDRLIVLHPLGSEDTDPGESAVLSVAALSMKGAVIYVQALAGTATAAADIAIKHSGDQAVWADLATHALPAALPGATRIAVAGTVQRHVKLTWAPGASPSVPFMVGFSRK